MRSGMHAGIVALVLGSGCGSTAGDSDTGGDTTGGDAGSVGPTSVPDAEGDEGCENGALHYGPVDLPRAYVGEPYEVDLRDWADPYWGGEEYALLGAADWLALADPALPIVSGTPLVAGPAPFTVEAIHGIGADGCSTMPDPHEFTLFVIDGSSGSSDGGSSDDGGSGDETTTGSDTGTSGSTSG